MVAVGTPVSPETSDIHPNTAGVYHCKVAHLAAALRNPDVNGGVKFDRRGGSRNPRAYRAHHADPGEKRINLEITLRGYLSRIMEWRAPRNDKHRHVLLDNIGLGGCRGPQPPRPTLDRNPGLICCNPLKNLKLKVDHTCWRQEHKST